MTASNTYKALDTGFVQTNDGLPPWIVNIEDQGLANEARCPTRRKGLEDHISDICRLYFDDGVPLTEIGKRYGVSAVAVRYWLKKLDPQQYVAVARKNVSTRARTYGVNEQFFETWSPTMAWVLGLLYSDGHVTSSLSQVVLTSTDWSLLEQVRDAMQYTGPIRSVNRTTAAGRLQICSRKLVADLKAIGITPAKSRTVSWPKIPPQFLRHFIRGLWDGDGCFHQRAQQNIVVASFVSGSEVFAKSVHAELSKSLTCFRDGVHKLSFSTVAATHRVINGKVSVSNELYRISFAARAAVEEFYWWLYDGVPASRCLSRKRAIVEQYLSNRGMTINQDTWGNAASLSTASLLLAA